MSKKGNPHWKVSYEAKQKWDKAHPYRGPYQTEAEAEAYCVEIRKVHRDRFTVIKTPRGYEVEQGLPCAA